MIITIVLNSESNDCLDGGFSWSSLLFLGWYLKRSNAHFQVVPKSPLKIFFCWKPYSAYEGGFEVQKS
jgi:hypothetical protein